MNYKEEISTIEDEWRPEDGFFWRVREGLFYEEEFIRVMNKLRAISIPDDADLPKRLVSLLWYVPIFMTWQIERVGENGGDTAAYMKATTTMSNEIERLLGVP